LIPQSSIPRLPRCQEQKTHEKVGDLFLRGKQKP
jgi:hypothetical protein